MSIAKKAAILTMDGGHALACGPRPSTVGRDRAVARLYLKKPEMPVDANIKRLKLRRFWSRHGRLVAVLTAAWAGVSFVPPLFVGGGHVPHLGMPWALWFMAEFAPVSFVFIAWAYARRADALDAEYGATDA
jgi:putative solute:sodium symporter small subunit